MSKGKGDIAPPRLGADAKEGRVYDGAGGSEEDRGELGEGKTAGAETTRAEAARAANRQRNIAASKERRKRGAAIKNALTELSLVAYLPTENDPAAKDNVKRIKDALLKVEKVLDVA